MMTEEDKQHAIGRLAESRKRTRENIALLEAELYAIAAVLEQIGRNVRMKNLPAARATFEEAHRLVKGDLSMFDSRLAELEGLQRRLADYDSQWAALGLD